MTYATNNDILIALELRRRSLVPSPPPIQRWAPFPGTPQQAAYESAANWIGYGGAAGGGKTDFLLGMAAMKHRRALLLRPTFPEVRGMIERSREIYTAEQAARRDTYNETLHVWRLTDRRHVEFGTCQYEQNKENYRGRPYDLYGFDEATSFSESQVRFITAWNRTNVPGQACRVVLTFNPPTTEQGRWVIRFFLPWMAYLYPELDECKAYVGRGGAPARPGELRAYLMVDGTETEVPLGTPKAKTRTFFPASVEDNPVYMAQGYDATLEAMPEPLRSQLRYGSFAAGIEVDPWLIIPRAWVVAAQARWRPDGGRGPCSGVGLDVARGGRDQTVKASLYGAWLAPLHCVPGGQTPDGPSAAQLVLADLAHQVPTAIDVIGIGASAYDHAPGSIAFNASSAARTAKGEPYTDRTEKFRFANLRAFAYWRLREALDPNGAILLALPPDEQLLNELTTPRWSLSARGILVESKDDLIERLGHSPDRADAAALAIVAPLLAPPPPAGKSAVGGQRTPVGRGGLR